MFGMDFLSFLMLFNVAVVVAAVMHYGMKYYVVPGTASFVSKVILAWVGAWIGGPIFGHWFGALSYNGIYFVPAVLGSVAMLVLFVDLWKTTAKVRKGA